MNFSIGRSIWVTFQKEGVHCYPAALTDPALKDVEFLGHPHRHMFHFKVEVPVNHDDRDIEFILLKRHCESYYSDGTLELNHKSCEMIAEELAKELKRHYRLPWITVTVSEDQENGATITLQDINTNGY